MKFSNIFIFFFLLVLTLSFVSAQPPFQQPNFDAGYFIEFSQLEAYEFERDLLFNIHVFNITNGVRIINTTTDCNFHLLDRIGNHQINQKVMVFDEIGLDWEFVVLRDNFTRMGGYSYLIVCNDSAANLGGFVSVGLILTADGNPPETFPFEFSIILFGLILIIFGLTKERYRLLQMMGGVIWIVMGIITLFPGYGLINWTTLTGKVLGFILIGMGFYFFVEPAFSRDEQEKFFNQKEVEDQLEEVDDED